MPDTCIELNVQTSDEAPASVPDHTNDRVLYRRIAPASVPEDQTALVPDHTYVRTLLRHNEPDVSAAGDLFVRPFLSEPWPALVLEKAPASVPEKAPASVPEKAPASVQEKATESVCISVPEDVRGPAPADLGAPVTLSSYEDYDSESYSSENEFDGTSKKTCIIFAVVIFAMSVFVACYFLHINYLSLLIPSLAQELQNAVKILVPVLIGLVILLGYMCKKRGPCCRKSEEDIGEEDSKRRRDIAVQVMAGM